MKAQTFMSLLGVATIAIGSYRIYSIKKSKTPEDGQKKVLAGSITMSLGVGILIGTWGQKVMGDVDKAIADAKIK